ncbi:hypothetical protein [Burkholderia pseudomallei]|uniref:hypothetical protein n=1 Tax=Burkholderia pseudomallei TaxID=28450 RepID=UPI002AB3C35D|nr:hypothetical protein [Burkholderia pseudomallei]MDY7779530.1 hypothetical protein [Burkholderia pseudomallei]MDY7812357.1 hypothetical protein [Burkholderia pseudomallei]
MPVILNNNKKSTFEDTYFDKNPAVIHHQNQLLASPNGPKHPPLSDAEIRDLAGAPGGSSVTYRNVKKWPSSSDDKPPPGLYLTITHPTWISNKNVIGLIWDGSDYEIYIKDVDFSDTAPKGLAGVMLAKIVRFCLNYKIRAIRLLAAGGRSWADRAPSATPPTRWGGYYVWARCGFDMDLADNPDQSDLDSKLFPYFLRHPANLKACQTVQDVIRLNGGPDWWRACGNGWFMAFDCSNVNTSSVLTLEAYLKEKSL